MAHLLGISTSVKGSGWKLWSHLWLLSFSHHGPPLRATHANPSGNPVGSIFKIYLQSGPGLIPALLVSWSKPVASLPWVIPPGRVAVAPEVCSHTQPEKLQQIRSLLWLSPHSEKSSSLYSGPQGPAWPVLILFLTSSLTLSPWFTLLQPHHPPRCSSDMPGKSHLRAFALAVLSGTLPFPSLASDLCSGVFPDHLNDENRNSIDPASIFS